MSRASDIKLRIGADDSAMTKKLKGLHNKIARIASKVERIGRKLTTNVTVPIVAFAAGTLKSAQSIDTLKKGLIGMLGDAKKAGAEFQRLRKTSKNAGLDLESTVQGSIRLQAIGFDADKAAHHLKILGNAVALVGGSGKDLSGVTLAITQILSKGKVHAEEINQMAERMPQVRKAMMDAFGTADTEILQKAGYTAEQFVDGIVRELGKLPKAQKTVSDRFNHMRDELSLAAATIGMKLLPTVMKLAGILVRLVGMWSDLSDGQQNAILGMTAAAAAAGPLALAFSKVLTVFRVLMKFAIANPFGAVVAGLVVGAVLVAKNWEKVRGFIVKVVNAFIDAYNSSVQLRGTVQGIKVLFESIWTTLKLMGKTLMNTFGTVGKVLKAVFKGEFKDIAGIIKEQNKEHMEILKEAGKSYGESMSKGIKETFTPLPKKHIDEADVDKFFEPIQKGAAKLSKTVRKLVSGIPGAGGGAGDEEYIQNLGNTFVRKAEVYHKAIETLDLMSKQTIGDASLKVNMQLFEDTGARMANQLRQQWGSHVKGGGFDWMSASFENILGTVGQTGWKGFWDTAKQQGVAAMTSIVGAIAQGIGDLVGQLANSVNKFYDNKLQRIENTYDREYDLIERSGLSEEAKQKRLAALEEAKDKKTRKVMRDQAKAAKAAAIFQSVISGIVAVTQALTIPPPAGPILAGVIGGLAAANTAAIASEPLPQLAAGAVVSGRAAVEVAEYAGARFNPEVIAPLDKLKSIIGETSGGGGRMYVEGRLTAKGDDLEAVLRANKAKRATLTV